MTRSTTALVDWAMIAAAFGLVIFILLSPTGSLVRKPVDLASSPGVHVSTGIVLLGEAAAVGADASLLGRED